VLSISIAFLPLMPSALALCCVYIISQMLIMKYWLLNWHCIPKQLNAKIIIELAKKLPFFVWTSSLMLLIVVASEENYADFI